MTVSGQERGAGGSSSGSGPVGSTDGFGESTHARGGSSTTECPRLEVNSLELMQSLKDAKPVAIGVKELPRAELLNLITFMGLHSLSAMKAVGVKVVFQSVSRYLMSIGKKTARGRERVG